MVIGVVVWVRWVGAKARGLECVAEREEERVTVWVGEVEWEEGEVRLKSAE